MKAAWLTDIHLNFCGQDQIVEFFRVSSREPLDCLFMSGDIGEADTIIHYLKQADSILRRPFYFILGNHDFYWIDELRLANKTERIKAMKKLADKAAEHFIKVLPQALKNHQHVIVLTHVPPFKEACWHQGQISEDDWLPFFSCKVVGDVLRDVMEQHPSCEMTVYCGYTHSSGHCQILPNLEVFTGEAEYGSPKIQSIIEVR